MNAPDHLVVGQASILPSSPALPTPDAHPSNITYNSVFRDIHGISYEPFRIPPKIEEARQHAVT
jgi:hypothetical protein